MKFTLTGKFSRLISMAGSYLVNVPVPSTNCDMKDFKWAIKKTRPASNSDNFTGSEVVAVTNIQWSSKSQRVICDVDWRDSVEPIKLTVCQDGHPLNFNLHRYTRTSFCCCCNSDYSKYYCQLCYSAVCDSCITSCIVTWERSESLDLVWLLNNVSWKTSAAAVLFGFFDELEEYFQDDPFLKIKTKKTKKSKKRKKLEQGGGKKREKKVCPDNRVAFSNYLPSSSDKPGKKKVNDLFALGIKELSQAYHGFVVYLDADYAFTTKTLKKHGIKNGLVMVNDSQQLITHASALGHMKGVTMFNGELNTLICRYPPHSVSAAFFDFCATFDGSSGLHPKLDIMKAFERRIFCKRSILAFTISSRANKRRASVQIENIPSWICAQAKQNDYDASILHVVTGKMNFYMFAVSQIQ